MNFESATILGVVSIAVTLALSYAKLVSDRKAKVKKQEMAFAKYLADLEVLASKLSFAWATICDVSHHDFRGASSSALRELGNWDEFKLPLPKIAKFLEEGEHPLGVHLQELNAAVDLWNTEVQKRGSAAGIYGAFPLRMFDFKPPLLSVASS